MGLRALAFALLVGLGSGCFALDEIDKGMDEMDRRSGARSSSPASHTAPEPAAVPGPRSAEDGAAWWEKARVLSPGEAPQEFVRCEIEGGMQFMRRTDCLVRGGREAATGG